jgi:hypothetical protein
MQSFISFTKDELDGVPADVISGFTKRTEGSTDMYDVTYKTPDIFPIVGAQIFHVHLLNVLHSVQIREPSGNASARIRRTRIALGNQRPFGGEISCPPAQNCQGPRICHLVIHFPSMIQHADDYLQGRLSDGAQDG